jgi:hypothetical protein
MAGADDVGVPEYPTYMAVPVVLYWTNLARAMQHPALLPATVKAAKVLDEPVGLDMIAAPVPVEMLLMLKTPPAGEAPNPAVSAKAELLPVKEIVCGARKSFSISNSAIVPSEFP